MILIQNYIISEMKYDHNISFLLLVDLNIEIPNVYGALSPLTSSHESEYVLNK